MLFLEFDVSEGLEVAEDEGVESDEDGGVEDEDAILDRPTLECPYEGI